MEPSFLLIERPDTPVTIYQLSAKRHVIGRRPDAEIVIDHATVSRAHAMLEVGHSGRWWIMDLGSSNGTYVNGAPVTERLLSRGDIIRIGDCSLVLRLASARAFPSLIPAPPSKRRSGLDASGNALNAFDAIQMSGGQRIGAEHLTAIMRFGRDLMRCEDGEARLKAFCEFVVGDMCAALAAAAIRIFDSETHKTLCTALAHGIDGIRANLEPPTIQRVLEKREPMVIDDSTQPESAGQDLVGMLIPFAELDAAVDVLHLELPPRYGNAEWLMLITLVAEAYQQAELVWDMRHQVRQNASIEDELAMACQIQNGLVPKRFSTHGLELAFGFEPCRWVGGDYVDALVVPDDRVLLAIADVCGKGMHAALVASSLHTLVRASRDLCRDLPLLVKRMNEYLLGYLPEHSFVTMLCVLVDRNTGRLELVSAGHPAAIVIRKGNTVEVLNQIENVGLGLIPDDFVTMSSYLDVGDVLLMYTDGLTEMMNLQGEQFGTERLATEFKQVVSINPSASVDSMRIRLTDLCNAFRGTRAATDDQTFLVAARRYPSTVRPPPMDLAEPSGGPCTVRASSPPIRPPRIA